jgi:hypothetical protein
MGPPCAQVELHLSELAHLEQMLLAGVFQVWPCQLACGCFVLGTGVA